MAVVHKTVSVILVGHIGGKFMGDAKSRAEAAYNRPSGTGGTDGPVGQAGKRDLQMVYKMVNVIRYVK